jgi:hypothetical protein
LLNNPTEPYQGRYEATKTRRKAAYPTYRMDLVFPVFCEAWRAQGFSLTRCRREAYLAAWSA